ncbi:hypothetical protein L7F22_044860 [Adiantum nelumboides]|nr:hypothetical protein [Adiantum nelumboides]
MTARYYEDMMNAGEQVSKFLDGCNVLLTPLKQPSRMSSSLALDLLDCRVPTSSARPGPTCALPSSRLRSPWRWRLARWPAHVGHGHPQACAQDPRRARGAVRGRRNARRRQARCSLHLDDPLEDAGLPNVKLFNATCAEDLIVKKDADGVSRVNGVVTNYTLVTLAHGLQSCMDPQTMTAPVVVSFCGHDGPFGAFAVKRLESAGLFKIGDMGPMDMTKSEGEIVNNTRELFPGIIVGGMELSEADSHPRMGASFAGMISSGVRASMIASKLFDSLDCDEFGEVQGVRTQ